jgi:hypothetical protein
MWVALVILFVIIGALIVRNVVWTVRQGAPRRRAARELRNRPRPR